MFSLTLGDLLMKYQLEQQQYQQHRGVIVSMLVWSAEDCRLDPWSGQTKDNKTGICCFSV
jgi:hypothetical protein